MKKRTARTIMIVIAVVLVSAYATCVSLNNRYMRRIQNTNDVLAALVFCLEANGGRYPESEAAFLANPFVTSQPDGSVVVRCDPSSENAARVYGRPIADLAPFKLPFGIDLDELRIDGERVVRIDNGEEVLLMTSAFGPERSQPYSVLLMNIAQSIKDGD